MQAFTVQTATYRANHNNSSPEFRPGIFFAVTRINGDSVYLALICVGVDV